MSDVHSIMKNYNSKVNSPLMRAYLSPLWDSNVLPIISSYGSETARLVSMGRITDAIIRSGKIIESEYPINWNRVLAEGIRTKNDTLIDTALEKCVDFWDYALIAALEVNDEKFIKLSLEKGADDWESVLERGAELKNDRMIEEAWKHTKDRDRQLIGAVKANDLKSVVQCVETKDNPALNTRIPYEEALRRGFLDIVKYLEERGANSTRLSKCVGFCGKEEVYDYFIEKKVELSALDSMNGALSSGSENKIKLCERKLKTTLEEIINKIPAGNKYTDHHLFKAAGYSGLTLYMNKMLKLFDSRYAYCHKLNIFRGAAKAGNITLLDNYGYSYHNIDDNSTLVTEAATHGQIEFMRWMEKKCAELNNTLYETENDDDPEEKYCISYAEAWEESLGKGFMEIHNYTDAFGDEPELFTPTIASTRNCNTKLYRKGKLVEFLDRYDGRDDYGKCDLVSTWWNDTDSIRPYVIRNDSANILKIFLDVAEKARKDSNFPVYDYNKNEIDSYISLRIVRQAIEENATAVLRLLLERGFPMCSLGLLDTHVSSSVKTVLKSLSIEY